MYFYLEWSRINDSYKEAWNGVRKDFPVFAECIRTETWKHQMRATTPVLLNLAEKSIDLCRTILFPLAFKRATSAAFDDDAEYLASIQRMMEVELFAPLYYHLLLTFAYNFVSRINEDWRHILAERYVRYWDNYAIPILESVFIFLMSDYFKCVEEVMDLLL